MNTFDNPPPTPGRCVMFVARGQTDSRPATIVRIWPGSTGANLQVFVDGTNDKGVFTQAECDRGIAWRTSVKQVPTPGFGTDPTIDPHCDQWFWPARV